MKNYPLAEREEKCLRVLAERLKQLVEKREMASFILGVNKRCDFSWKAHFFYPTLYENTKIAGA